MQEKRFRNQVSWMMFLFSILVIWVHSYNVELFAGSRRGAAWDRAAQIEKFVSSGIGQAAVPGFFMLSSYLFFRNFTLKKLFGKWKGRFFSVAVPYAAWNILYYLGYVAATRLPAVQHVVGKEPIPFNMEEVMGAVLNYSYAPIFWYLYQLIFLIILSPVIYILVKNKITGIAYLCALLAVIHLHMDTGHPNTDALFYYSFAAYAAVHGRRRVEPRGTPDRMAASMLVLAAGIFCYGTMNTDGADVLWTIFYRMLIPVWLWLLISCMEMPDTRPWMRQSMFLYAVHFIVVRFVNKGAAMIFAGSLPDGICSLAAAGIYFFMPAIVTAASYCMALVLTRYLPAVWRVLSGGRNLVE